MVHFQCIQGRGESALMFGEVGGVAVTKVTGSAGSAPSLTTDRLSVTMSAD